MHERIERNILQYALCGQAPVLTPIEQAVYERYCENIRKDPDVEWYIPTGYPDSGIVMRYAGTKGDGLTRDEVDRLSEVAEAVIGILESGRLVCEDGALTVAMMT